MATSSTPGSRTSAQKYLDRIIPMLPPVAVVATITLIWVPELFRGLWLDEFQTYWIIKDGFEPILSRTIATQGFSPLYFYLSFWSSCLFGTSELALRLPSFLLVMASTWGVFLLAQLLFGGSAAWLTTLLYVTLDAVINSAVHARPYGPGLLAVVLSFLFLEYWAKHDKSHHGAISALAAAACLYFQFLFAPMLFVLALRTTQLYRNGTFTLKRCLTYWGGIGILTVPLLPQILSIYQRRGLHEIAPMPSWARFLVELGSPIITLMVILALSIALLVTRDSFENSGVAKLKRQTFGTVIFWYLLPTTTLFLVSKISGTSIFLDRFASWGAPALALLLGAALPQATKRRQLRFSP